MKFRTTLLILGIAALLVAPAAQAQKYVYLTSTSIDVKAPEGYQGFTLSTLDDCGVVRDETFEGDTSVSVTKWEDGRYRYEVNFAPIVSKATLDAMALSRKTGDTGIVLDLRKEGLLPWQPFTVAGDFTIEGGRIIEDEPEPDSKSGKMVSMNGEAGMENIFAEDFLILDDLIVDGSACIGFDCVNGESFGFDTIRLKENNLRIKFQDTSVAASFPSTDWQLIANDSANGGANKFTIQDFSANRNIFTVEANAPNNSLYVDDGGRIGIRTSTPVAEIHVKSGDTPTLRLEQDGSSGFAPQTWDVAGNETSFFIRDASNGSTLPFRIRPGAASQSLVIDENSEVGIGTLSPDADFEIERIGADILVNDTTVASGNRTLMKLSNNGPVTFSYENRADGTTWNMNALNGGFAISLSGSGINEFFVNENGDIEAPQGTVIASSSRTVKRNIQPVDPSDVLARVLDLPVHTWEYDKAEAQPTHLGPMAEDFYAAFGLGSNERSIALSDTAGVALAAIQGLHQEIEAKDAAIEELKSQNQQLLERLEALEQAIQ